MATPCSLVPCTFLRDGSIVALLASLALPCMAGLAVTDPAEVRAADAFPAPDDRLMSVGCWDIVAAEWDGAPDDKELLSRLQFPAKRYGRGWGLPFCVAGLLPPGHCPTGFHEPDLKRPVDSCGRSRPGSLAQERARAMVVANRKLLRMVRRLTIRDELLTMRLRGVLVVVPVVEKPVVKPEGRG